MDVRQRGKIVALTNDRIVIDVIGEGTRSVQTTHVNELAVEERSVQRFDDAIRVEIVDEVIERVASGVADEDAFFRLRFELTAVSVVYEVVHITTESVNGFE